MATGDLEGNLNRLLQELRLVKFPLEMDVVGLRLGDPISGLRILHHGLLDFSEEVAKCLLESGYELRGKTDKKFVEMAFRLSRDVLGLKLVLTSGQFLQQGFAERKLLLLCEVLEKCRRLHEQFVKRRRLQALKIQNSARGMHHHGHSRPSQITNIQREGPPFGTLTNTLTTAPVQPKEGSSPFICLSDAVQSEDLLQRNVSQQSSASGDAEIECCLVEEDSTSSIENLVCARDPQGIKPQAQTRTKPVPDLVLSLQENVEILQQDMEDLKEMFVSELQEISDRFQEPCKTTEVLINRITALETRVKFLEAESRKELENKEEETARTPERKEALIRDESERGYQAQDRSLQDIIADLTTRQNSADSFLKSCKNLET